MKDHRSRIRLHIEDDAENASLTSGQNKVLTDALRSSVAMMCEFMAAAVEFIQFSREYYTSVCGLDKDGSSPDEKTCLIPICAIQSPVASMQINQDSSTATEEVGRKRSHSVTSAKSDDDQHGAISGTSSKHFGLMAMERERCLTEITARQNKRMKCDIPDRGEGLNAYCMRGVDDVLQILSKAADCMRHIVDLCQWASVTSAKRVSSDWEEAFCKLIDQYKLPFDIYNAVLLTRSDLSLSSPSMPGNLAKALRLSQTICDRIELQRRRDKKENISRSPELDIPFMFAFRVLYNIGVIYLLVGSLQQSTLEIAIILSVFPIPIGLSEKDFIADEADCYTAAKIFQGHDFGMMRVTQEGLVVRCIKHLIVSLDSESGQQGGMASIDSAMRWDEKAGNMIVLMQFGWPYWNARTNFWEKIISRMKERRVFKNRGFLEYVYVPEILQVIRGLHESGEVLLDIIPPEFTMRGGYRHLMEAPTAAAPAKPSACTITEKSTTASHSQEDIKDDQADDNQNLIQKSCSTSTWNTAPCQESSVLTPLPRSTSEPSSTHATGPNTPMSPSWYSTSTRKSPVADWMSPSFCYSRPVMSNMLSKRDPSGENVMEELQPGSEVYHRPLLRKEIVTRCLDYRMQKYSPKMTPTRMRHVLQKFLKNMVLKANEET
ncbi:hypothetical protein EC973_005900 [Apophysomyces ossiformis]|uniref:Uncharacterized protein n=1 Tax=Apophysomyces ossiformis TaxID=679940 RepID=A0A8H7EKV4_9FUNG|nr:hypothetical protein EC973_005900 [Apophysomyces ossiformis]